MKNKSKTIDGCGKHSGQSFIDCPLCKSESFVEKHNVTEKEEIDLAYHLVILKAKQNDISPESLMKIVQNYNKLKMIFKPC